MAENQKSTPSAAPKMVVFESKWPGLQLHLEETETKKGAHTVKGLRMVQFKPNPAKPGQKPHEGIGLFATADPVLAAELRQHTGFNRDFREI
jgi:hypothetical protein